MSGNELDIISRLEQWFRQRADQYQHVITGIGDDLSVLQVGESRVLTGSDIILAGTHFDPATHTPEQIANKAIGAVMSDCAAMAARPLATMASVSLPHDMKTDSATELIQALASASERYGCPLVGGDTTSWKGPLAIDAMILGVPWPGVEPVLRSGAQAGDQLFVTGQLGGSILGKHVSFHARIEEAHQLATALRSDLHAMIDITDGLSLDLWRICRASRCSAELDETSVLQVASKAAQQLAKQDGNSVLDHVLGDGEDYELLAAISPEGAARLNALDFPVYPLGRCCPLEKPVQSHQTASEDTSHPPLYLLRADGEKQRLMPRGWVH